MPGISGPCGDSYYRRLGVGQDASHDDIVRAHRRQAFAAHPDAHPEDPDAAGRFQEITEAYEVLADPGRRAAYDRQALGARARVHVQDAPLGDARRAGTGGWARPEGDPVVLGRARPGPGGDVPLRVGPVQVERTDDAATGGPAFFASDLYDLVDRIVETWRGP